MQASVSHHALAGVGTGDSGELALERACRRPAVHPFHFDGRRRQRGLARLPRTVDNEAGAWQRLEGGADGAVGVEVVRPGRTAAQREDRVRHRPGFVGANAKFAPGVGDALRAVGQRKGVGAGNDGLGGGRQVECGEGNVPLLRASR